MTNNMLTLIDDGETFHLALNGQEIENITSYFLERDAGSNPMLTLKLAIDEINPQETSNIVPTQKENQP